MQPTNAKEEFVKEGADRMTEKDVEKVIVKSEDIQQKFSPRGPLHRFVEDAKLLIAMIKDYWNRSYRQVPFGVIGAIAFTLIYVLNPFDIVPDVLPLIGQVDDAAVFAGCLMLIESDLRKYKDWKDSGPTPPQITG